MADNINISTSHGSGLAGTPNIDLTWSPVNPSGGGNSDTWQAYNTWTNLSSTNTTGTGVYQMGTGSTSTTYNIIFTPDTGYSAILNSVDFNIYTGGGNWTIAAKIFDHTTSTQLGSTINLTPKASDSYLGKTGNSHWSLGNYTGTSGQVLRLSFNVTTAGTSGGYIAVDNIMFNQVPEPSSTLLGGLGVLFLLRRRR